MNYKHFFFKSAQVLLGIFVFGVVALLFLGRYGYVNTFKPYVIQSGSMEPSIKTGSVIFSFPAANYNQGDIITFLPNGSGKNLVTHRIEAKLYPEGVNKDPLYLTSGDANEDFDKWNVRNEHIVGKVVLTLPYLGYMVDFAKKPQGFILLVIIPATIIIYEELKNLLRELRKIAHTKGGTDSPPQGFSLPKASILIPAIGASFVLIAFTASFLLDKEDTTGNIFGAAASFASPTVTLSPSTTISPTSTPTPTPSDIANHLVINEVMFNPPNPNACGSENNAEWVEIYNPTSAGINLDTWSVGDTLFTDDLPNVILPAGAFAVVSDCLQASFTSIWPIPLGTVYIDISSAIGNGLNNGGEHIRLLNTATLIDDVSYGTNIDAFSPSVTAPVANHSIERDPDGKDTDSAGDFVDRSSPSPGS